MQSRVHLTAAVPAQAQARICIFSQRGFQRSVSRSAEYEFEDLICEIDQADLLTAEPLSLFKAREKVANQLARRFAKVHVNPGLRGLRLDRDYDLFFMICQFPRDLLSLNAVRGWRDRCRKAVCWVAEIWSREVSEVRNHLRLLSQFDYVVIPCMGTVQSVRAVIGDHCLYMPPGIDTILFCPYPHPPQRAIDVFGLGRRSVVTHEALLKLSEQRKVFYVYDTVDRMDTHHPRQHRHLVANMAKRSRYFIANAPKMNRPFETNGQREISYRLFEGAAAGTVLIGDVQRTDTFNQCFDWPDAVLHMPYDTTDVESLLADWDSQPQRLNRIRKNGIIQSLLRHDWAYRWQTILDVAGLDPRPALAERIQRLESLAHQIERA